MIKMVKFDMKVFEEEIFDYNYKEELTEEDKELYYLQEAWGVDSGIE